MLQKFSVEQIEHILKLRAPSPFRGCVYRTVALGGDPRKPSGAIGRWGDGTFNVLYTSLKALGSKAEMDFHVKGGQSVEVSKPVYHLYKLSVDVEDVLDITGEGDLDALGIDTGTYRDPSYAERHDNYTPCQVVAKVAHSHPFGGLLVPSARYDGANLVILYSAKHLPKVEILEDMGPVNFKTTGHP